MYWKGIFVFREILYYYIIMKHQQKFYTDLAACLFSGLPQLESSIHLCAFMQDYNIITDFLTPLLVLSNYYLIKQKFKQLQYQKVGHLQQSIMLTVVKLEWGEICSH